MADATQADKQSIGLGILAVKRIEGTQFTTYIHPDNIYSNGKGDVKFVHRGIRSVLPPEAEDGQTFVYQLKCLLIAFFSGESFISLLQKGLSDFEYEGELLQQLKKAKSLKQLGEALEQEYQEPEEEAAAEVEQDPFGSAPINETGNAQPKLYFDEPQEGNEQWQPHSTPPYNHNPNGSSNLSRYE